MIIESEFQPAKMLANRHVQTLIGPLLVSVSQQPKNWSEIALPDGDFMEIAWFGPDNGPLLLILHGLEGSYRSHYIQRVIKPFITAGWRIAVAHFRGCGRKINARSRSYHSGSSDDLTAAIEHLQQSRQLPTSILGFSLGGNVLLKWLGENPDQQVVKRAMAVSVPFKLDVCATSIGRGFSRTYQKHLIGILKKKTRQKLLLQLPGHQIDEPDWRSINNFWQFDHLVTAPLNGFNGVNDYYQQASSYQFLPMIKTPTLILQALDDPFMSPEVLPEEAQLGPGITLELSQFGGHVGFFDQLPPHKQPCFLGQKAFAFLTCQ